MKSLITAIKESLSINETVMDKELKFIDNIRKSSPSKLKKVYDEVKEFITVNLEYTTLAYSTYDDLVRNITLDIPEYFDEIEDELEDRVSEYGGEWFYNIIEDSITYFDDLKAKDYDALIEIIDRNTLTKEVEKIFRKIYK